MKITEQENTKLELKIEKENTTDDQVAKMLNWKYPKIELTKIEGKSSVSKISKQEKVKYTVEAIVPEFIKETEKTLTGTEIGTTVHLVKQKLDFKEEYDLEKINALLEELIAKKIISNIQKEVVPKEKILKFTQSELFKELKNAKKIHTEEPLYINTPVKKIYDNNIEENILIQGIIDLYYIDKDDKLVLVDYKTDYVPENDENYLIEKYKNQLELYAKALNQALNKKVSKVYIYSTYLNRVIEIC